MPSPPPFFPFPQSFFSSILVVHRHVGRLTSSSLPPLCFLFSHHSHSLGIPIRVPSLFPGFPLPSFRSESRHHRIARHTARQHQPNHHLLPSGSRTTLLTACDCSILFSKLFLQHRAISDARIPFFADRDHHLIPIHRPLIAWHEVWRPRLIIIKTSSTNGVHTIAIPTTKTHTWASKCPPSW